MFRPQDIQGATNFVDIYNEVQRRERVKAGCNGKGVYGW